MKVMFQEEWKNSSPKKINNVIHSIINGKVKLKNPDKVLAFYTTIQSNLDWFNPDEEYYN